jgi:cyanophycinase
MRMPKGILLPIGGGEDKKDEKAVLERFLDEIGKKDPRIEIITTATSLPREVGNDYKDAFDSLGSRNYDVMDIRNSREADDERMLERLQQADGVFFTGGDQSRLIDTYCKTKFLDILKQKYQDEHFVIAGTSAGCAAMSAYMIQGGTTEEALNKGEIRLTTGLGFIEGVVFDTHFTERGRFARLMNIVATNPNLLCLGFGEDTAAVINNGTITVTGSGVVTIIDGGEVTYSTFSKVRKGDPFTIERLIVHLLSEGETFSFSSKKISKNSKADNIVVKNKSDKWEVFNEGDSAVLFSTEEKDVAVKFADEVARKHNLKVNVQD